MFQGNKYREICALFDSEIVGDEDNLIRTYIQSLSCAFIVNILATKTNFFGEQSDGDWRVLAKNPLVTFIGGLIFRHEQLYKDCFIVSIIFIHCSKCAKME